MIYNSPPSLRLTSSSSIVEVLIRCPTSHELWFAPPNIDILKQNFWGWFRQRHLLSFSDLTIHCRSSIFINLLKLIFTCDTPVNQFLLQAGDGILCRTHALDF